MGHYEHGDPSKDVDELGFILRAWCRNSDSDSVQMQFLRRRELSLGEKMLEDLVWGVQPEQKLQLTIGTTAIEASWFRKGPYDIYTEAPRTVEPHTQLDLVVAEVWNREMPDGLGRKTNRRTLFAGSRARLLSIDRIASTLIEGGQLSLIKAEPAEATPAAD